MGSSSFLAEIVKRYVPSQWENIATEALAYLLRRPGGEHAFLGLIEPLGLQVPGGLDWVTQVRSVDDRAIPDLVGQDASDRPVVMVEVKFWAGLTSKQPNDYLGRQDVAFEGEADAARVLIFLAPERRIEPLARELAVRTSAPEAWAVVERIAGTLVVSMDGSPRIVVLSWGRAIGALDRVLRDVDDAEGLSALSQLAGMCDRADQDAMLPLALEEVGSDRGRRLIEFHDIVDKVADRVSAGGIAAKAGGGQRTRTSYGWRMTTRSGSSFRLRVDLKRWATQYPTPFWLRFRNAPPAFKASLRRLEAQREILIVVSEGRYTYVGLDAHVGVTAEELVDQVTREVGCVVAAMPVGGSADTDDDVTDDDVNDEDLSDA